MRRTHLWLTMLALLGPAGLLSCSPQSKVGEAMREVAGVQQYATLPPDAKGTFEMGVLFPRLVSFEEVGRATGSSPLTVVGGKHWAFGGGGTYTSTRDDLPLMDAAREVVETYADFAQDFDVRNREFLKGQGQRLTAQSVAADQSLQSVVHEGVLSARRIDRFRAVDERTPIMYALTLKGSRDAFVALQQNIPGTTFFRSPDRLTPPQPEFVKRLYAEFHEKNDPPASKGDMKAMSLKQVDELYEEFRNVAKQRYGVDVGGSR